MPPEPHLGRDARGEVTTAAPGRSRLQRLAPLVVVALLAGTAGWAAGRQVLLPPADPLGAAAPVTTTAQSGKVGRSLPFVAVGRWTSTPAGTNSTVGVVTDTVAAPGEPILSGSVLFRVDERPVVAVSGQVPWFRALTGGERGRDVTQLQQMLIAAGHLRGGASGRFDAATARGVRAWQRSLEVAVTGQVGLGDVVVVPGLPARVRLGEAIRLGARLTGGEVALERLPDAPSFAIPLDAAQAELIPLDSPVLVSHPGGTWAAEISKVTASEGVDQVNVELTGPAGAPVCGKLCVEQVDVDADTRFSATVQVVPETAGVVVPVAAVTTDPVGLATVLTPDGVELAVQVVASDGGLAVVTGIESGQELLLPAVLGPPADAANMDQP